MRKMYEVLMEVLAVLAGFLWKVLDAIDTVFAKAETWFLEEFLRNHRNPIRCFWHGLARKRSMAEYRQDSQHIWRVIRSLGFLVYPLAYVIMWIIRAIIRRDGSVHGIIRLLIVVMTVYALVDPTIVIGWQPADSIGVLIPTLIINHILVFNPIKAMITLLIFDCDVSFDVFMHEDADDWALEEERQRGRLHEYDN